MGSCDCVNEQDSFKIAYLVVKGWTLDYEGWKKEGFKRTESVHAGNCNCCFKDQETSFFKTAEDAYWAQQESEDG